MIEQAIFGAAGAERQTGSPLNQTFFLPHVQPVIGRRLAVREVFARFQNLNLRV
jgi:hypothetical protein